MSTGRPRCFRGPASGLRLPPVTNLSCLRLRRLLGLIPAALPCFGTTLPDHTVTRSVEETPVSALHLRPPPFSPRTKSLGVVQGQHCQNRRRRICLRGLLLVVAAWTSGGSRTTTIRRIRPGFQFQLT